LNNYVDLSRQKKRLTWLCLGLVVLSALMTWRLFHLQVMNRDRYLVMASQSHNRKYSIPASRGQIYLKDGEGKVPLALNQNLKLLYADPSMIKDKVKTSKILAPELGESEQVLYQKLNQPGEYVVLKRQLSQDAAKKIAKLNLIGINSLDQPSRTYPEGSLAAQVVGFVNGDGVGQYGIEGYLNEQLAGKPGLLKAKTDVMGNPIATADNIVKAPENGTSYVLTIDRNIQAQAEKFLRQGVENVKAKSGSVIIMDPKTGAIRAMANWPSFDPNNYGAVEDYSVFSNAVVSNQFEPGSGFKAFAMAAGLDSKKVRAETTFNDTGEVEVDGRKIRNAANHKYGISTMSDVMQKSLNTGMVFILKQLGGDADKINLAGKKLLHEYITKKFGFGVATGIEQSGEAAGHINPPSNRNGNNVNYANMTFGQGLTVTMLQMVDAIAAVANGGELYQPYLIEQSIAADQSTKTTQPKLINGRVISSETSRQLTEMMVRVVEHGSGWPAKMKGYRVAGKTGTAQIPKANGQGYEETKNIGSFVGFAPVDDPKFVMMVRINEPNVAGFAESTTVPVFAQIAQWLVGYYGIPPQS
jgi:cell division protein FtsI (penicillin-binding protein 3)